MKILIINHSPLIGSGSGIYTMNIAKALKEQGQEVRVRIKVKTRYCHGDRA